MPSFTKPILIGFTANYSIPIRIDTVLKIRKASATIGNAMVILMA